jgi:nucleoside-diphosphate-sugar epimerase
MKNRKTVSVIGSEGGLGRLVCNALRQRYSVRRVDLSCANAEDVVRGDVRSQEDMEQAVAGAEIVIHLAAFHGGYNPPPTDETRFDVNVVGTFRMFQACLKKGIKRVVWGSSIAAMRNQGCYSMTKVLGEDLCEYYHLTHGMQIAMMRYGAFTPCDLITYGERLLGSGVDLRDCVNATIRAVDLLSDGSDLYGRFTILPDHKIQKEQLASFGSHYREILGVLNPEWLNLIDRYSISIPESVTQYDISFTQAALGFQSSFNFFSFMEELERRDRSGGISGDSPRWWFEQGIPAQENVPWPDCLDDGKQVEGGFR